MQGETSDVKNYFIYILTAAHVVHVLAGIICLTVVTVNTNIGKYAQKTLGFELGELFWHFLGALWNDLGALHVLCQLRGGLNYFNI